MPSPIKVGDRVRLKDIPSWLVDDLPENERREIIAFIGSTSVITEIDKYGYLWLGFGEMQEDSNGAHYSGHSFCVPPEYLELIIEPS